MKDSAKHPCVVFIANRGFALKNSRLQLMKHFVKAGWRVVAATADDEYSRQFINDGIILEPVKFNRGGFSPLSDFIAFTRIVQIFRKHSPLLVHHFHAKPVILGTFAARLTSGKRVKVVNTITGLGHAFTKDGITQRLAGLGYRLFQKKANITIFQNSDDQKLFEEQSWIESKNSRLIVSSGVDISRFSPPAVPKHGPPVVLMVGRLLWQKGVREFVEAAKIVKKRFPCVRFQLAGEFDLVHPDAVHKEEIEAVVADGSVEFLGYLNKLEDVLPLISVFVFPSSYREGVPRVILEAAACSVPTIGTDAPGLREAVIHGKTGLLVSVGDIEALAKRICEVLDDETLRRRLSEGAQRMAREKFSIEIITEKQIAVYREIGINV